jgi:hypothetical protein
MAMTTLDETAELVRAVVRQLGGRFSTELGIDVDADDAEIGRRHTDSRDLASALDDLPGWGPVTVGLFLRELRGVWPGARVPLDAQVVEAARHLGLLDSDTPDALEHVGAIASRAGLDVRDLEAAFVRLALRHRRLAGCPGGHTCTAVLHEAGRGG